VQGHYNKGVLPSPAATIKRLDELASTGLKVWITELDYHSTDMNERANAYEQLLRLFFSHPAVEGVVMWAPWGDDNGGKPTSLVDGSNLAVSQPSRRSHQLLKLRWFQFNAAGNNVKNLINGAWKTNENLTPTSRTQSVQLLGFYGGYEVKVLYNGAQVSTGQFYLAKGHTASFDVKV
jgi:endo-1,4-beta-xylanase